MAIHYGQLAQIPACLAQNGFLAGRMPIQYELQAEFPFDLTINGHISGGNLSLLAHYDCRLPEGFFKDKLVFIEETGEAYHKIDRMLSQLGVWFFSPQAGPFGRAGIPDRVACVGGRFVGIEVKADRTKKPTQLQRHCMAQIEAAGGKCFVVFDVETLKLLEDYINAGTTKREGAAPQTE
jgi:hypothetical protein